MMQKQCSDLSDSIWKISYVRGFMNAWVLCHSLVSSSLLPHGLQPARLLCPRDSPGKNSGTGCHFLLQGIFLTQGSNPSPQHLLHRWAGVRGGGTVYH